MTTIKHLEWEYDETTTFYGSIVDGEVEDFEVLALVGGDWESVTLRHERMEKFFKDKFLDWALTQPKPEPEPDFDTAS